MPFWNLFWLIVPAVTLIGLAIAFFVHTGKEEREESKR